METNAHQNPSKDPDIYCPSGNSLGLKCWSYKKEVTIESVIVDKCKTTVEFENC